ncbi:MAG: thiamine-phosphate pyrophosphorylase [Candidatus Omnitrophica bacterium]|nr:thiamine-phosphate pyrophosphorylase [Candidatus Omnitrophota bacterium]
MIKKEIYRIIDANLNRSREGLRVCEEITRFVLNSRPLTQDLKSVRHSICKIMKCSVDTTGALAASRDSDSDVLRCSRHSTEMKRSGAADIFAANIERVKESLRVLEEFFKLIDAGASSRFCGLRFKVYAIEKNVLKQLKRKRL